MIHDEPLFFPLNNNFNGQKLTTYKVFTKKKDIQLEISDTHKINSNLLNLEKE